ncbi:uncharacterized protein LOC126836733 [Adelges cooleyi]|uniref:uncharacterized protein LOC126836733 n=1 Tax=Adelges cooleyi TaxID=133065 RepID=UPI00217FF0B6|nr:uncharacterized protein LOC126836733 [Adelges cooleyi]
MKNIAILFMAGIILESFSGGSYSNAQTVMKCKICDQPVVVTEQGTPIPESDHSSISLMKRGFPDRDGHLTHFEYKWIGRPDSKEVYESITLVNSRNEHCGHHPGQHFSWDNNRGVWKIFKDCAEIQRENENKNVQ